MSLLEQLATANNRQKLSFFYALELLAHHCSKHSGLDFKDHWKAWLMIARDEVNGIHPEHVDARLRAYVAAMDEWLAQDIDAQHQLRLTPNHDKGDRALVAASPLVSQCVDNNSGGTLQS